MTIDQLVESVPEKYRPWASTYGPAFLVMTAAEVKAWIEMLVRGDVLPAYKAVIEKLPNADLLSEWNLLNAEWQTANEKNADRIALQRSAALAILKILLGIALAAVGL